MNADYEEKYWKERGSIEPKHYWQVIRWLYYFEVERDTPIRTAFDYGCGRGEYVHAFRSLGVDAVGFDISKHAVENSFGLSAGHCFNVLSACVVPEGKFDLVAAYDVLEHLELDEIQVVLQNIFGRAARFALFSVCMAGDSNYEKDETHKTKRTRAWWVNEISKAGFKKVEVPDYWLFKHQLLLFEV